jgi:hypothetical protein
MEITGVHNAKDIQALSMVPSEGELLIHPNTDFKVKLALSCDQAQPAERARRDHSRPRGPRDCRGCTARRILKSAEARATGTSLATECADSDFFRLPISCVASQRNKKIRE